MRQITVRLSIGGRTCFGQLEQLKDATLQWHLTIDHFHRGVLQFSEKKGWSFHTKQGRIDEWAQILGKAIEDANPERSFNAELPPPFKLFDFDFNDGETKGLVEVHCLREGSYYFKGKNWIVTGIAKSCNGDTYFWREKRVQDSPPAYCFNAMQYKHLIERLAAKIEEIEGRL